jgi:hypothetical protein
MGRRRNVTIIKTSVPPANGDIRTCRVLPDWKRRRQESAVCESVSSSGRTVSLLLRALNSRRTTYLLRGKIADAFAAGIVKLSPMQWKS